MTNAGDAPGRNPGWDAKVISRVATDYYRGMDKMFAAHKWPERGSRMMTSAPSRIKAVYGSIEAFEEKHAKKK
jgi:hypothetical protein